MMTVEGGNNHRVHSVEVVDQDHTRNDCLGQGIPQAVHCREQAEEHYNSLVHIQNHDEDHHCVVDVGEAFVYVAV